MGGRWGEKSEARHANFVPSREEPPSARGRQPPTLTHHRPHAFFLPLSPTITQLRFQRFGRKKAPFYRLVAIDSRDRREGRPLERLGFYDPLKKETSLNAPAIKKWLAVGAQPTETVANLLKKAMVLEEK